MLTHNVALHKSQHINMLLNLIAWLCAFVIITVRVNDAEREGHCSGVAGGMEDMYLSSLETLIKQHSVHIISHHKLAPQRAA